jgi:hypothetical protein
MRLEGPEVKPLAVGEITVQMKEERGMIRANRRQWVKIIAWEKLIMFLRDESHINPFQSLVLALVTPSE